MFFSCRKANIINFSAEGDATLFSEFSERNFSWADEIEGGRLSEDSSKIIKLQNGIKMNPVSYAVFVANRKESLYPFLEDFGSLDLTTLSSGAKEIAEGFCKAFCSETALDEFMDKTHLSSLVFFNSDVDQLAGEKSGKARFSQYIYGKPFESSETFALPVCFWNSGQRLMILLYLNKNSDWKINQIQIKKWQES